MFVYRIRRKDGLFSTGGHWPDFSKKGKVWKAIGHLKNHLQQVDLDRFYKDCELVAYEIVEMEKESKDISALLAETRQALATKREREAVEFRPPGVTRFQPLQGIARFYRYRPPLRVSLDGRAAKRFPVSPDF